MGTGTTYRAAFTAFSLSLIAGFFGCTPAKQSAMGEAITAKAEIAAVSAVVNDEERYRLSEEDLALLEENDLLDEETKLALQSLSSSLSPQN